MGNSHRLKPVLQIHKGASQLASSGESCYPDRVEILRTILLYSENHHMPFVVIGGHAINSLGFSRHTGDLDLLVPLRQKKDWQELLGNLKYKEGQSDSRFSQFAPSELAAWPIDLMYVDDSTFEKLQKGAVSRDFGLVNVPVAAPEHLVLLKLHALKYTQEHRTAKDYGDLLFLLSHPDVRIPKDELKKLCLKYATQALFDKLEKDLAGQL